MSTANKKNIINIRQKYNKTPKILKMQFLRQALLNKRTIKQIADDYNIKYTTALTMLQVYKSNPYTIDIQNLQNTKISKDDKPYLKKHDIIKRKQNLQMCSYREIKNYRNMHSSNLINQNKQELNIKLQQQRIPFNFQQLRKIYYAHNFGQIMLNRKIEIISRVQNDKKILIKQNKDDFQKINVKKEQISYSRQYRKLKQIVNMKGINKNKNMNSVLKKVKL